MCSGLHIRPGAAKPGAKINSNPELIPEKKWEFFDFFRFAEKEVEKNSPLRGELRIDTSKKYMNIVIEILS